jgi:hypothetical protein
MTSIKKSGAGDAIAKMTDFKDQMCKCADKACADKVTEQMTKWGTDMAKEGADKAGAISEEDTKKMAAVTEEMIKCMTTAMTGKKKSGAGDAIAKMTDFKDQMCKCADKACADKVTEQMTKWGTDMAKEGADKAGAISEEEIKKMSSITDKMTECMTTAMTAGMTRPPA